MFKTTVEIEGMMCQMCEAHVNDALRAAFDVKKVTSSHSKGETEIISESEIDKEKIREVLKPTGYTVGNITSSPYEKKGLFSGFRK